MGGEVSEGAGRAALSVVGPCAGWLGRGGGADQIGGAEGDTLRRGECQEALVVARGDQAAAAAAFLGQSPAMDGAAVQPQEHCEGTGTSKSREDGGGGINHGHGG